MEGSCKQGREYHVWSNIFIAAIAIYQILHVMEVCTNVYKSKQADHVGTTLVEQNVFVKKTTQGALGLENSTGEID